LVWKSFIKIDTLKSECWKQESCKTVHSYPVKKKISLVSIAGCLASTGAGVCALGAAPYWHDFAVRKSPVTIVFEIWQRFS
jgi:hypothetical protein